jgi:hypothetical protein
METQIGIDLKAIYDDLKAMIRAEVEAELGWQEIATEARGNYHYSLLWNAQEDVYKATIKNRTKFVWEIVKDSELQVWHGGTHREAILRADAMLDTWVNWTPKTENEVEA